MLVRMVTIMRNLALIRFTFPRGLGLCIAILVIFQHLRRGVHILNLQRFFSQSALRLFITFVMIFSITLWNTSIVSKAGNSHSGSNLSAEGFLVDNLSATLDFASGSNLGNDFYIGVGDDHVGSRLYASGYIYWILPPVLDYRFSDFDSVRVSFSSPPSVSYNLYKDSDGNDSYYISGSGDGFFAIGPYTSVKSINELKTLHSHDQSVVLPTSDNKLYRLYYVMPFVSRTLAHPSNYKSNCLLTYNIEGVEITGFHSSDGVVDRSDLKESTDRLDNTLQESNDIAKETQETTKGIFSSITEFFGSFFQNLIDSVIGLFVPSSEEMSGLFDQLNQFFSDRFGFLYAPFDYMIQLLGVFTSAEGSTGLTFPGFSIMGYEVWSDLTYDLAADELVGTILEYVRIGTGILLGGWFIMYLQDFFKERFSQ